MADNENQVVVDDTKVIQPEAVKAEPKKVEEPRYFNPDDVRKITEEAVKKATAPLYYELRQIKQKNEVQPVVKQPSDKPADELDNLVQTDWKAAVRKLAHEEAQQIRKAEMEQARVQSENERRQSLYNQNAQSVLSKHPDLSDEHSEKAQVFKSIVANNPGYQISEYGPILAMRDMEEKLKSEGKYVDEPTKKAVEKETTRIARTNATSVPTGTPNNNKKYTLSAEDREFCDSNGIKYEVYATMRGRREKSSEVSV